MKRPANACLVVMIFVTQYGCPRSNSTKCAWGDLCSPGNVCHEATQQCVLAEQVAACRDLQGYVDCEYPGSVPGTQCRDGICVIPYCGDAVLDPGEECDDGNEDDGDGCSTDCLVESVCGNGTQEPGEECDGDDLAEQTCTDLGFSGGVLSCLTGCSLDTSDCIGGCSGDTCTGSEVCFSARCVSPPANCSTHQYENHLYALCPYGITWGGARSACGAWDGGDGYLFVVNSYNEYMDIRQGFNNVYFWIAWKQTSGSSEWSTTYSNHTSTYTYWSSGEPNNGTPGQCGAPEEDCCVAGREDGNAHWNDDDCTCERFFVCELNP